MDKIEHHVMDKTGTKPCSSGGVCKCTTLAGCCDETEASNNVIILSWVAMQIWLLQHELQGEASCTCAERLHKHCCAG